VQGIWPWSSHASATVLLFGPPLPRNEPIRFASVKRLHLLMSELACVQNPK